MGDSKDKLYYSNKLIKEIHLAEVIVHPHRSNRESGILRDKTMEDKLIYIPVNDDTITPSVD